MPFDRPHDLTVQLYSSKLPFGFDASLVGFYQSGFPYTGTYEKEDGEPVSDVLNRYKKRSPAFRQIDISFSKFFELGNTNLSMGIDIFNVLNIDNVLDVYEETGKVDERSEYYLKEVKLPQNAGTKSGSYYDQPWRHDTPREINIFIQIEYK